MYPRSHLLALFALAAATIAPLARADCTLGKFAEFPVTMQRLSPIVTAKINGADASLVLDLGAYFSTLKPTSVERFGLKPFPAPFGLELKGVTGRSDARMARVQDFTIPAGTLHNVDFLVGAPGVGASRDGLLGRNVLAVRDVELDLANGVVRLMRPQGCEKASLAYWAQSFHELSIDPTPQVSSPIVGAARLNGVSIRVLFDTGAQTTVMTLRAARRAGIKIGDSGVVPAGHGEGTSGRQVDVSVAPFASFEIGGETFSNVHLRLSDIDMGDADMLLGADFFVSHRVYVARSQNKLYFTDNGAPGSGLDAHVPNPPGGAN